MERRRLLLFGGAVAVVAMALGLLWARQQDQAAAAQQQVQAQLVSDVKIESEIRRAEIAVDRLVVRTVGDIVILRGEAKDTAAIERASEVAKSAGAVRVANLIRVPQPHDDHAIRREAERQLTSTRALDGCNFTVTCERGILKVEAKVRSELQEDATRAILKTVPGAVRVETEFSRF